MSSNAILVINENFAFGGLETQLCGYFRQLKKRNYKIVLAVGEKVDPANPFIESVDEIVSGLSLSGGVNNIDFRITYQNICKIIDEHRISVIHCQPFFAFLPAFFASQEKRVPFVYSLHGPVSITYIQNHLHEFLLKEVMLKYASIVHCVSREILTMSFPYTSSNAVLVPNLVDTNLLDPVQNEDSKTENNAWAIFSRLDEEKVKGIIDFIQKAANSGIATIDIYGDGSARKLLEDWNFNNQTGPAVFVKGFRKLDSELVSKYAGIGGMGRVVLEAISNNKPCVLIGYNGVKGLIDKDLFEFSSTWNFSGRGLKTISAEQLSSDLKKLEERKEEYCLREQVVANYDEGRGWKTFIDRLDNLEFREYPLAKNILNSIEILANPEEPILYNTELLKRISSDYAEKKMREDFTGNMQMVLSNVQQINSRLEKELSSVHQTNECLRSKLQVEVLKQNEARAQIEKISLENDRLEKEIKETRSLLQIANAKVDVSKLLEEELKEKETTIRKLRQHQESESKTKRDIEKTLEDCTNRIQELEKSVSWYHATYVSRSLLGVVKDKALKKRS